MPVPVIFFHEKLIPLQLNRISLKVGVFFLFIFYLLWEICALRYIFDIILFRIYSDYIFCFISCLIICYFDNLYSPETLKPVA